MSRVGEKVKAIRNNLGMTQKQLAKKLGVAEGFVNEIETGRRVINQSMIDRLSKILGKDFNDITMSFEEQVHKEEKGESFSNKKKQEEVKDVWNEAFGSVFKNVPVYKVDMSKPIGFKQLPLTNNKVEGYAQDKVLYLEIEDDDMIGYRIAKGDIAFAHITHEVENNAICLIEYDAKRAIRQIKRIDNSKLLLLSNRGSLRTETVGVKDIKVIAKLDRLEIKL